MEKEFLTTLYYNGIKQIHNNFKDIDRYTSLLSYDKHWVDEHKHLYRPQKLSDRTLDGIIFLFKCYKWFT